MPSRWSSRSAPRRRWSSRRRRRGGAAARSAPPPSTRAGRRSEPRTAGSRPGASPSTTAASWPARASPRTGSHSAEHMRAVRFHGPGDLRVEDVPRPEPGPGDVLVQVEVALTDGTDLKTFRRGHPVLLGELPSPFGHEFCGIDVATGKRVVAANSAAGDERGDPLELLNGAYAEYLLVPAAIATVNLLPVPRGLPPEVAAMVEP